MTEKQVSQFMHAQILEEGVSEAWDYEDCPAVNSGPESPVGHSGPTDIILERGHLVHFDFGVKQDEYCSDIQRMVYLLKPGETEAPAPVQRAFQTVVHAIQEAVKAMRPGVIGAEIDQHRPAAQSPMPDILNTCTVPVTGWGAPPMMAAGCSARIGRNMAICRTNRSRLGRFTRSNRGWPSPVMGM